MSDLVLLVVGLVLCFAGARSLRLTILIAGFGLSWLLADAFDASTTTTFLVSVVGAVAALVNVLRASGGADTFWVAFLGGAASWWVVFLLLPKPMRAYVFAHELTHALWTWLFLGRVKKFKAGRKGEYTIEKDPTRDSGLRVLMGPFTKYDKTNVS